MTKIQLFEAGFKSLREAKKFAKMYALLHCYRSQVDNGNKEGEIATTLQHEWAYSELNKMKMPIGYESLGNFDEVLQWFKNNCR